MVTPIAAHALSNRPLVLDPDSKLTVRLEASTGPARFLVDGQPSGTLEQGQSVSIQRHPKPYPLLAPGDSDPWRRLRERLGWRGSFLGDEG